MRLRWFTVVLVAALAGCGGDIPIPDLPCPPLCPPEPGEAYDCDNPPQMTGFIAAKDFVEGRVMIVLKRKADRAGRELLLAHPADVGTAAEQLVAKYSSLANIETFLNVGQIAADADVTTILALLTEPNVAYVKQVETYTISRTESWGTDRSNQRDLPLDGNDDADLGESVHVVVIDTGVSYNPDFGDRLSEDCGSSYTTCRDGHGHGTHCAGTIGGKVFGVAKGVTLHGYKALADNGSGSTDDVVRGINWAVELKQRLGVPVVASMSLGGPPDPPLDQAVCDAMDAGIPFAIAAGNDYGDDSRNSSPSRVVQAVTVAASTRTDQSADFSNAGPGIDVWAPGKDIMSTRPGAGSQLMSGTSMATPHVAAGLAILLHRNPGLSARGVSELLVERATPGKISFDEETTESLLFVEADSTEPDPEPEPDPDVYCESFPQGLPESAFRGVSNPGTFGGLINRTMASMTGCSIGSDCPTGLHPDVWMARVEKELHAKGYCAGRHDDTPPGASDQISVKASSFCNGGMHENYKIYNYGGGKVIWHPGAKQDAWFVECR